jgi:hypothetical protein
MVGFSVYRGVRLKDAFKQDIDAAVMKAEQTGKQNDRLNRLRQARDHEFLRFPPPSAGAHDELGRTNTARLGPAAAELRRPITGPEDGSSSNWNSVAVTALHSLIVWCRAYGQNLMHPRHNGTRCGGLV